jgi:hypothetical protein
MSLNWKNWTLLWEENQGSWRWEMIRRAPIWGKWIQVFGERSHQDPHVWAYKALILHDVERERQQSRRLPCKSLNLSCHFGSQFINFNLIFDLQNKALPISSEDLDDLGCFTDWRFPWWHYAGFSLPLGFVPPHRNTQSQPQRALRVREASKG